MTSLQPICEMALKCLVNSISIQRDSFYNIDL